MRLTHVARLALIPVLAAAPAFAAATKGDGDVAVSARPVSTGIVAPFVDPVSLRLSPDSMNYTVGGEATVILSVVVNEKGRAENIRVTKSASPLLDARVINQVQHAAFQPATLNHKAIPVEMSLTVHLQR